MLTVWRMKPAFSRLLAYLRASRRSVKPSTLWYSQSTTSEPGSKATFDWEAHLGLNWPHRSHEPGPGSSSRELLGAQPILLPHLPPPHPSSQHGALSPMKALGIVILSHMRSRTSSPDSGEAMAFTMAAMSLWMDR